MWTRLVTGYHLRIHAAGCGTGTLKIALIRRVRASAIDRARLSLIVNVIESFLTLTADEQRQFHEQLQAEGDETVEDTELPVATSIDQVVATLG
jgi:hypothetical protein